MATCVINMTGGPSCGKSTVAAGLFYLMKVNGFRTELVTEFAKDLVYEGRLGRFKSMDKEGQFHETQDYLFSEQHRRMSRLREKVDFIITDSPLILNAEYADPKMEGIDDFKRYVRAVTNSFDNHYFIIQREKPFRQEGRVHTEDQAKQIDKTVDAMLKAEGVTPTYIRGNEQAHTACFKAVLEIARSRDQSLSLPVEMHYGP